MKRSKQKIKLKVGDQVQILGSKTAIDAALEVFIPLEFYRRLIGKTVVVTGHTKPSRYSPFRGGSVQFAEAGSYNFPGVCFKKVYGKT